MNLFLSYLLITSPLAPPHQTVIFNTPTHQIYVVDFNQTPIEIMSIHENTYLPISCLENKPKKIKDIEFSNSPSCLVNTLNQNLNLKINHSVDMKNNFTEEQIKKIAEEKKMSQMFSLIQNTSTSYSYFQLYDLYNEVKDKNFQYTFVYPTTVVFHDLYIPLNK